MAMKKLKDVLEENAKKIDERIEKYIPKRYDGGLLQFVYKDSTNVDLDAVNRAISEPFWEFLGRGGKRWRPTLFLLVYEALGGDPKNPHILDFSIIPEIIHNGTLMVDDIEDGSQMRRGKPTLHRMEEFGLDIALNCGNFMYYLPLMIVVRSNVEDKKKLNIYEAYIQEMVNLSLGQGMDLVWHKGYARNVSIEEYIQMCSLKTGTLARMSSKFAGILAGADDETIKRVGEFIESLGVAFQIQDDVLDITGSNKFGKTIGGDITEGKRSFMVVHVLQDKNAKEEDKRRLREILDMHTGDKELIREAIDIIREYGAVDHAKGYAEKIVTDAWNDVDEILPESVAKNLLKEFKDYLIEREI